MKQSVKWVTGNWKMFGLSADLAELTTLSSDLAREPAACRVVLFPSAALLSRAADQTAGTAVEVGGQNCNVAGSGAFTGEVSAEMLADAGARLVIVGHSERRTGFGETSEMVRAKAERALEARLEPIICVGETCEQRDAGQAVATVTAMLDQSLPDAVAGRSFAVAYEPIWAIGTGRTPTPPDIAEAHAALRSVLVKRLGVEGEATPILYGGSVKPDNAAEIMAIKGVGGVLVGGASLKAADFIRIVRAA